MTRSSGSPGRCRNSDLEALLTSNAQDGILCSYVSNVANHRRLGHGAQHDSAWSPTFNMCLDCSYLLSLLPTMSDIWKAATRSNKPVIFFDHVWLYTLKENIMDQDYVCYLEGAEMVRPGKYTTILTSCNTTVPKLLKLGR